MEAAGSCQQCTPHNFAAEMRLLCLQYEISAAAYETLSSTPDAQGRKLEVHKVPCPPPLFRTHKEADGVAVSPSS